MGERLPRSFYARPPEIVAPDLLGMVLVRSEPEESLRGRIVEVEAYGGDDDPASHAFRGRTVRNQVMFGLPGHLYVYFTYGMHYCLNVVAHEEGRPGAVLIRAVEPVEGLEIMAARRPGHPLRDWCRGPARLCRAFGVDRDDNGIDLVTGEMAVEPGIEPGGTIVAGPRVGIRAAADRPWRFHLAGNRFVSGRVHRNDTRAEGIVRPYVLQFGEPEP